MIAISDTIKSKYYCQIIPWLAKIIIQGKLFITSNLVRCYYDLTKAKEYGVPPTHRFLTIMCG